MNDGIMYVWQVVGDWSDHIHFTCLRKETAEYLRDWLQAEEVENWRNSAKACNVVYAFSGHHQLFSIQEGEVIL